MDLPKALNTYKSFVSKDFAHLITETLKSGNLFKKGLTVCRICRIVIYIWKFYEHYRAFKQTTPGIIVNFVFAFARVGFMFTSI